MISVIMAHYKREELLYRTLWGYRHLHTPEELKNVEFVIVDDGGGISNTFWKVIKIHSRALNITAAAMSEKTALGFKTHNTSGPMNFGIKLATGDLFVLTNPENIPMTPHLLPEIYGLMKDKKNRHLSGNCYSLSEYSTSRFMNLDFSNKMRFLLAMEGLIPFEDKRFGANGVHSGWRQHSEFVPNHFFFLASIWKEPLFRMRGFDERFLQGQGGEDVDFVNRVKKLGMELFHTDDLLVIHQFHYGPDCHKLQPERIPAVAINKVFRLENAKDIKYVANTGKKWGAPESASKIIRWHKDDKALLDDLVGLVD